MDKTKHIIASARHHKLTEGSRYKIAFLDLHAASLFIELYRNSPVQYDLDVASYSTVLVVTSQVCLATLLLNLYQGPSSNSMTLNSAIRKGVRR